MSGVGSKRVWTAVDTLSTERGIQVRLDGKPVLLPRQGIDREVGQGGDQGGPLLLQGRALADAVALEWRNAGGGASGGAYGPNDLGLTRLASTLQVRVAPGRGRVIETLLGVLDSDALCYRATHPEVLVARQALEWQPWLDWCRHRLAAELAVTHGVMPIGQSTAVRDAIARCLDAQDDAGLTVLGVLAPTLGSLVLALAVVLGALAAASAHAISILDDRFSEEQWGHDREAAERQRLLLADCIEAERFLRLSRLACATRLLVEGRVQGVGYRAWLQGEAVRLGASGWVRNLRDGRVEALLLGPAGVRDALRQRAGQGPALARVGAVSATMLDADETAIATTGFTIGATVTDA